MIKSITEQGIDVIGMVKATNQRYSVDNKWVDLKNLYKLATPTNHHKDILRSVHTTMANGIPVKVVFIRNRNNHSCWLAILSTDCSCSLTEQEQSVFTVCVGTLSFFQGDKIAFETAERSAS